jgi:hypothetical protein
LVLESTVDSKLAFSFFISSFTNSISACCNIIFSSFAFTWFLSISYLLFLYWTYGYNFFTITVLYFNLKETPYNLFIYVLSFLIISSIFFFIKDNSLFNFVILYFSLFNAFINSSSFNKVLSYFFFKFFITFIYCFIVSGVNFVFFIGFILFVNGSNFGNSSLITTSLIGISWSLILIKT